MKRLFTFGCSHTCHHYPTWANLLGEEFHELYNFGKGGSGPLYSFHQISSLVRNRNHFNLTEDDFIVWLITEENRFDAVVEHFDGGTPHFNTSQIYTIDNQAWFTKKYIREVSVIDGITKTLLYVESVVRLLQNHNLNFRIIPVLDEQTFFKGKESYYRNYSNNLKKLIGEHTSLQAISRTIEENPHYYFIEGGELHFDGHWSIPIHAEFCRRNFDFYKGTNLKKYMNLHKKYITKTVHNNNKWKFPPNDYQYEISDVEVKKPTVSHPLWNINPNDGKKII